VTFSYKKINDFIVDQVIGDYTYQNNEYKKFTQPKNAVMQDLLGVELAYQRDFSFIAPALKCIGFYGTYTYTHTKVNNFNFEGRENEKDLSLPGSPEHTANASLYFEKKGFNVRLSYNYASSFIDEMGEVAALDRLTMLSIDGLERQLYVWEENKDYVLCGCHQFAEPAVALLSRRQRPYNAVRTLWSED